MNWLMISETETKNITKLKLKWNGKIWNWNEKNRQKFKTEINENIVLFSMLSICTAYQMAWQYTINVHSLLVYCCEFCFKGKHELL